MRSPMTPAAGHPTQDDGWILVRRIPTGGYTKTRSPQHNDDNMSSRQVANASASNRPTASVFDFSEESIENITYFDAPAPSATAPAHKPHTPESSGDSSTQRASTEDTLTDLDLPLPTAALPPNPVPLPPGGSLEPARPQLTQSNMDFHQRELAQRYQGSIAGWVAAAGTGPRLAYHRCPPPPPSSSAAAAATEPYSSMLATAGASAGTRSGSSSVAAGAGTDWLLVSHLPAAAAADDEVAAAGAWCEVALGPLVRRFSVLTFDADELIF
ncbi:e6aacabf-10dd-4f20-9a34-0a3ae0a9e059 [Thermothielavioides terrestris]|nr:e6aacabf-10dd-4f20-9a34-0a3ae0a9e059 [Thermothielavioides terrestris]